MKFKSRNLRELAELVIGDSPYFHYRSSKYITEFFEDCGLDFVHDGSTRAIWTSERLAELLARTSSSPNVLPPEFVHVFRVLMEKADAEDDDPDRSKALESLNKPLSREGFQAYYAEDEQLYIRHVRSRIISVAANPHRPLTPAEVRRRDLLRSYLAGCSEDELIENVLLPVFRQLGFHRVTAVGHKDKALEYGKDIWMRYMLPTQHVLYFGLQVKKGKLDAAGATKRSNANIAEIYNQLLMMLGHEVFDPETSSRVLVDHAIIVAAGEITKQARNWLGQKLDSTKRSQVLFMDRDDIVNLYTTTTLPLPKEAQVSEDVDSGELPF